jgi:hypothetical protein
MTTDNKITTHFTKGLIIGLVLAAIGITLQILEIYDQWVQYVITGLYFLSIMGCCWLFGKEMNGDVTFGKIFSHGFKTAAIVILITIASFIITSLVMPDQKEKALELARENMEKDPRLTASNIEDALKLTDKFYYVIGIVGVIFGFGLSGALGSLLGAVIAKKNPPSTMPKSL